MFLKLYQRYTNSLTKIRQQFPVSLNKTPLQTKKNNILPMRSALVGLDINTNSVTWAQIHPLPNQPALLTAYETLYFKGNVSKILKTLPQLPHCKTALGVALPDTSVQVTTLALGSHLSLWELRKILKEKSIALLEKPIKEIYFQYQVLGFVKNQPNHLQFLLVAVLKKTLYDYLHLLKTSHLKPQLIDVESFARERGETILKNQQLQLAPNLQNFLQDADRLAVSIGLGMHPCLKK
jgi:Tfp pilus assembly PilM family ATPase